MNILFAVTAIILLTSMSLLLYRALKGPTVFDRILAVNSFGTAIVILVAFSGLLFDTEFFLDVAIIYALINFITTIAFLRYFKFKPHHD